MKRRGFTLIELLAVIVVLAIIALITVPILLGVIEKAKKGAFKDGVYSIFSSSEIYLINSKTTLTSSGVAVSVLPIKNNKYVTGKIIRNASNQFEIVNVSDGTYCANGTINDITISKGRCGVITPTMNYVINEENKTLAVEITDSMGIDSYSISEENRFVEASAVPCNGKIEIDFTKELTAAATYYIYVKDITGEITGLEKIEILQGLFFTNAIANNSYGVGDVVNWSNLNWYVLSDNTDSVTLILKANYSTGIYGNNIDWNTSTVYGILNNEFINGNELIKTSKDEGSLIYDTNNSTYVRLPYYNELSDTIPNESNTAFWTMTSDEGGNFHLGGTDGKELLSAVSTATAYYRSGFSVSCSEPYTTNVPNTAYTSSIRNDSVLALPTVSTISFNTSTQSTIVGGAGTAYTGHGTYTFGYCTGSSTATATTYCWTQYATNCSSRTAYTLTNHQTGIGYRPVVTIYKK